MLNNGTVVFTNTKLFPFNAYAPVVHAMFASISFLTLVILNSSIFNCLFDSLPNDIVSRSIPIMVETLVVLTYSQLFDLPTTTTVTAPTAVA